MFCFLYAQLVIWRILCDTISRCFLRYFAVDTLDGTVMPYTLTMHRSDLLWVVMSGHLDMDTANSYFDEVWRKLDSCPCPTDMLVDGRSMKDARHEARSRTEQIIHHPHLGHMAFIVSQKHLLWLAPLARLVNGIGLCGTEQEAVEFLEKSRHAPPVRALDIFKFNGAPEHPFAHNPKTNGVHGAQKPVVSPMPPKSNGVSPYATPTGVVARPAAPVKDLTKTIGSLERPDRRRR